MKNSDKLVGGDDGARFYIIITLEEITSLS